MFQNTSISSERQTPTWRKSNLLFCNLVNIRTFKHISSINFCNLYCSLIQRTKGMTIFSLFFMYKRNYFHCLQKSNADKYHLITGSLSVLFMLQQSLFFFFSIPICRSSSLSLAALIQLSIYQCFSLNVYLSIYLSIYISIYLSTNLILYIFICRHSGIYLCIYLSSRYASIYIST